MLIVLPEHLQVTAEVILSHSLRMRSYTVHVPKPVSVRGMPSNTATQKNPHHAFCVQRSDLGTSFPHTLGREDQCDLACLFVHTKKKSSPAISGRDGRVRACTQERQHASHKEEGDGNPTGWIGLRQICKRNRGVKSQQYSDTLGLKILNK